MKPSSSREPLNGHPQAAANNHDPNFIDLHELPFAFNNQAVPFDDDLQLIDETGDSPPNGVAVIVPEEDDEIQFVGEVSASKNQNGVQNSRKRKVPLPVLKTEPEKKETQIQVIETKRVRIAAKQDGQTSITELIENYCARFPKKFLNFDRQIMRFYEKNVQNDVTFAWKMRARVELQQRIAQIYPTAHLYAVGSTINGCGSFDSDMDLCCYIEGETMGNDRHFGLKALRRIRQRLFKTFDVGVMKQCVLISAKVPILRIEFGHPYDSLQVDLNVNNEAGIRNSFLLHYYSRIDDRFPALCLLIKKWAKQQSIADAMMGTLNSYSLILLCIHYLQSVKVLPNLQALYPERFDENRPLSSLLLFEELEPRFPSPSTNRQSVGQLLIGFFDYVCRFPFETHAISIRTNRIVHRRELPVNTKRFYIFVEEPFDLNNTARCVTLRENYEMIMEAFRLARARFLGKRMPDLSRLIVQ